MCGQRRPLARGPLSVWGLPERDVKQSRWRTAQVEWGRVGGVRETGQVRRSLGGGSLGWRSPRALEGVRKQFAPFPPRINTGAGPAADPPSERDGAPRAAACRCLRRVRSLRMGSCSGALPSVYSLPLLLPLQMGPRWPPDPTCVHRTVSGPEEPKWVAREGSGDDWQQGAPSSGAGRGPASFLRRPPSG